jgi:hypothetical protein
MYFNCQTQNTLVLILHRNIILLVFGYQIFLSCTYNVKDNDVGVIQLKTIFFSSDGDSSFIDIKKVWYKDSVSVQKINRTNFVTDTTNVTKVSYSTMLFRFIDLKSRTLYDYKNFVDTALPFNKSSLPDSMMKDYGWNYYSDKVRRIQKIQENLNDTIIDNVNYKRIKFNFQGDDLQNGYKIGYFRCDRKAQLFSLEKVYSKELNCTMTKFVDFEHGRLSPHVSMQIEIISDSLSEKELKVLDTWERNIKKYPVNN